MRRISSTLAMLRQVLSDRAGYLLFVEIESQRSPGKFYRLVASDRNWHADGKTWRACEMKVEAGEENADAARSDAAVTISNVSRLLVAAVELDDDINGSTLTATIAHSSNLAAFSGGNSRSITHRVVRVKAKEVAARLECAAVYGGRQVPGVPITRENTPGVVGAGGGR